MPRLSIILLVAMSAPSRGSVITDEDKVVKALNDFEELNKFNTGREGTTKVLKEDVAALGVGVASNKALLSTTFVGFKAAVFHPGQLESPRDSLSDIDDAKQLARETFVDIDFAKAMIKAVELVNDLPDPFRLAKTLDLIDGIALETGGIRQNLIAMNMFKTVLKANAIKNSFTQLASVLGKDEAWGTGYAKETVREARTVFLTKTHKDYADALVTTFPDLKVTSEDLESIYLYRMADHHDVAKKLVWAEAMSKIWSMEDKTLKAFDNAVAVAETQEETISLDSSPETISSGQKAAKEAAQALLDEVRQWADPSLRIMREWAE